jgi:hypothetical protein
MINGDKKKCVIERPSFSNTLLRPPLDMIISLHSPADMLKILQSFMYAPARLTMHGRTI